MCNRSLRRLGVPFLALLILPALPATASADGGVEFVDIAAGDMAGISYRRVASPRDLKFDQIKQQPLYTFADIVNTPLKPRGAPGVAMFDFDGDGDQDLYVTNGPGAANSLYSNQLVESGAVTFVDVGTAAGVGADAQDSDGTCVGDIDNDGDADLLVLGMEEPSVLFENNGDGTFSDITALSDIGGGNLSSTTCSFGDVDGDGLLDVVVGNAYTDMAQQAAIFVEPFAQNQHNQLFHNEGAGVFTDVSAASGIENTTGFSGPFDGNATITWAIGMVDIDLDGDMDIVQADDQAAFPPAFAPGGIDRGFIHVFENDGSGNFTDVSAAQGTNTQGQWMGLSFGDLDCDGSMDMFGSNIGDYMFVPLNPNYQLGDSASRWFLQGGAGFSDPGVGDLVASVFGWGSAIVDYDNDGDNDIIYHGGLDVGPFVEASNDGVILQNQDCSGTFVQDTTADSGTDHQRRNVQGLAIGDLDDDGFADIVTVANQDGPPPTPLVPYGIPYGSEFDDAAFFPTFAPTGNPFEFVFTGIQYADGTLSVEMNSGDNGNRWVKVTTVGSVDITDDGQTPRDGTGAVVSFTPHHEATTMRPVADGGTYASSHSRELSFGLGGRHKGTIDVLWPGGVRNRLYGVHHTERIEFPEIPCSIDAGGSFFQYKRCVRDSLRDLKNAGVISNHERVRFFVSAIIAFFHN